MKGGDRVDADGIPLSIQNTMAESAIFGPGNAARISAPRPRHGLMDWYDKVQKTPPSAGKTGGVFYYRHTLFGGGIWLI